MTTRIPLRAAIVAATVTALALAGCTSTTTPVAATSPAVVIPTPAPTPTPTTTPVADPALAASVRLVTQEGLAIALASNVLQSQLQLVKQAADAIPGCQKLPGGGSLKVSNRTPASLTDHIYYDTACQKQYMEQPATVFTKGNVTKVTATAAYFGLDGSSLGSMKTDAQADFSGSGLTLEGLGTYSGPNGLTATLGLACQTKSDTVLDCQGGVAQDFSQLGQSLGSVTPLTLKVGAAETDPIVFSGSKNSTSSGVLGAVSIGSSKGKKLKMLGGNVTSAAITTKGKAGGFVLFPPTPTGWTVKDATHDVTFAIDVTDDTKRELSGTVKRTSTGVTLATFQVDRSGTGTITYTGQFPTPITNWILTY